MAKLTKESLGDPKPLKQSTWLPNSTRHKIAFSTLDSVTYRLCDMLREDERPRRIRDCPQPSELSRTNSVVNVWVSIYTLDFILSKAAYQHLHPTCVSDVIDIEHRCSRPIQRNRT